MRPLPTLRTAGTIAASFRADTLSFVAHCMRELQVRFLVATPRTFCADMIKARTPLLPERRMCNLEPVTGHRLLTKRTLA